MQTSTLPSPSAQFTLIISWLLQEMAARCRLLPWTEAMTRYVERRLRRIDQQFQRLAALIAAGEIPRERTRPPRPPRDPAAAAEPGARGTSPAAIAARELGTHIFGWVCRWVPPLPARSGAGVAHWRLAELLRTPEMRALLAATPRMRAIVRPLCWMLAVEAELLPPAPPRRPRRRPVRATPPAATAGAVTGEDGATAAAPVEKSGMPFVRLQMGPEGSMTYPYPDARGKYPKGTRRLSRGPGFVCRP